MRYLLYLQIQHYEQNQNDIFCKQNINLDTNFYLYLINIFSSIKGAEQDLLVKIFCGA